MRGEQRRLKRKNCPNAPVSGFSVKTLKTANFRKVRINPSAWIFRQVSHFGSASAPTPPAAPLNIVP